MCGEPEKMLVHRPDILVDGDIVVVYDYKQVAFAYPCIVETFECEPSRQCPVSYQGDGLGPCPLDSGGLGETEGSGY